MSDSTSGILQKAYELIENDELEQARALLTPLLETDAENPSLWWVYSHALRDRSIGQLALDRVIALDPEYPGAAELKADVLEVQEQEDDLLGLEAEGEAAAQSTADVSIDDWEDLQPVTDDAGASSGGRQGFVLLVVAIGAALVASGAVDLGELLSGILPTAEPAVIVVEGPTDEPAIVLVGEPSEEPTAEVEPEPSATDAEGQVTPAATTETEAEPTVEASAPAAAETLSDDPTEISTAAVTTAPRAEPSPIALETNALTATFLRDLAESIQEFELNRESSGITTTLLGETLVLQVCAVPGQEFNARLNRVMDAVVELAEELPEGIEAIAAGLINCSDEDAALRMIGVDISAVLEYAAEEIDAKEFQRTWQPLS